MNQKQQKHQQIVEQLSEWLAEVNEPQTFMDYLKRDLIWGGSACLLCVILGYIVGHLY